MKRELGAWDWAAGTQRQVVAPECLPCGGESEKDEG